MYPFCKVNGGCLAPLVHPFSFSHSSSCRSSSPSFPSSCLYALWLPATCERNEAERAPCGAFHFDFSFFSCGWMNGLMDGWMVRSRLATSVRLVSALSTPSFPSPFFPSSCLLTGWLPGACERSEAELCRCCSFRFPVFFCG